MCFIIFYISNVNKTSQIEKVYILSKKIKKTIKQKETEFVIIKLEIVLN